MIPTRASVDNAKEEKELEEEKLVEGLIQFYINVNLITPIYLSISNHQYISRETVFWQSCT